MVLTTYYKLMKQLDPHHQTTYLVGQIIRPKSNQAMYRLRSLLPKL